MTMLKMDTQRDPARRICIEPQQRQEPRARPRSQGGRSDVTTPDLVAVADRRWLASGFSVALVEQPYHVAGRHSAAPAHQLDATSTARRRAPARPAGSAGCR